MTRLAKAPTYAHSGKATPRGLVFGFASLVVAPFLGALYAVGIFTIPFIYLNAILTLVFGGLLGFGIASALRAGEVRSAFLSLAFVAVGTALAYYVHWAVWLNRLSEGELALIEALRPDVMLDFIGGVYDVGAWSLAGNDVSGMALGAVWAVELALIFGASLLAGFTIATGDVYCESCGRWCDKHDDVLALDGTADPGALQSRLAAGDLAVLGELPRVTQGDPTWFQINLQRCHGCGQTNTLNLDRVTLTADDKGKEQRKEDRLLEGLLLTPEQADWVTRVGGGDPSYAG